MSRIINCCVVGDLKVGKSCMVESYLSSYFPRKYQPTILDVYSALVNVGNDSVTLRIFDVSGSKDDSSYRKEIVKNCDVVLVCYSMIAPESLNNVKKYWIHEIRSDTSNVPIILVGTQLDVSKIHTQIRPIETKAKEFCELLELSACIECSALTQEKLKDVFDQAVMLCIGNEENPEKKDKKNCVIV